MVEETAIGGQAREFPPTRWTLIVGSKGDPEARRRALAELLAAYWKPLYACARRKGLHIEDAKDAVQGLCARLLDRDFLEGLDPGRGPLRAYLKAALQNHLASLHEGASALKRGGDREIVPLDFDLAERHLSGLPSTPEDAFEREWAEDVMDRATGRLRREFESGLRKGPFDLVLRFFQFGAAPSCAEAARENGMTVPQLKAFLHRARVRFREIVREEVADTAAGDPDREIEHLLRVLGS